MSRTMRNVKKVVEKVNHSSKLRTNIQAQMAVGNENIVDCHRRWIEESFTFYNFQLVRRWDRNSAREE